MKKQWQKLFGRKKTSEEDGKERAPVQFDVRLAKITPKMKDIAMVCKHIAMKKDGSMTDLDKFALEVNMICKNIEEHIGEGSKAWIQRFFAGDIGAAFCEQMTFPTLLVEALDRIRLFYVVNHVARLGATEMPEILFPPTLEASVLIIGECLKAIVANAKIMESYRCELCNMMRLVAELYTPCVYCVRSVVATTIAAAIESTFNAGIVWYLHDSRAITSSVESLRQLTNATKVNSTNALEALSTLHSLALQADTTPLDTKLAVSRALGLISTPEEEVAASEIRPAEYTFTLSDHNSAVGLASITCLLKASSQYTPVLLGDFEASHGYDMLWKVYETQDAAAIIDLFKTLLSLGEGTERDTARNENAFLSLKGYLFNCIGSAVDDSEKQEAIYPLFQLVQTVYTSGIENFRRLEPRTHCLASLLSKLHQINWKTQPCVLSSVEFICTHLDSSSLSLASDILSMLTAMVTESSLQEVENPPKEHSIAIRVSQSIVRILTQAPLAYQMSCTLVEFGILDRGLYPVLKHATELPNEKLQQLLLQFQAWAMLTKALFKHSHSAVSSFRSSSTDKMVYLLLKDLLSEQETVSAIFSIFKELSLIDNNDFVQNDIQMLINLSTESKSHINQLGIALGLLHDMLHQNNVQAIWCNKLHGLEALAEVLSSIPVSNDTTILYRVLAILSTVFENLSASDATPRAYMISHKLYPIFAQGFLPWLTDLSPERDEILNRILLLVFRSKSPTSYLVHHAEALSMLFLIVPSLQESHQTTFLSFLHSRYLTRLSTQEKSLLIRSGIFQWLYPLISTAPNKSWYTTILQYLAKDTMNLPHLRDYLRVIHALPPSLGLQLIYDMTQAPAVPHILLQQKAYVQVTDVAEKLWPPVSGYSVACWLHFPPQGEHPRKSHTVSLALCEGTLMQDTLSMYAVLVGPTLTLYRSKEDAVAGCSDIGTHEITDYHDIEQLSFSISTSLNDELVFRTESLQDFEMWRKTLVQVVVPRTYVNLISIYALEQPQCYTRIYFDANSNCLRIDTSSSAQSSTMAKNMTVLFRNVDISLFATHLPSWHHVVLTHRKSVVGSSIITLYIDGAEVTSKKLHYPSAPVPCSMQCFFGQDPQYSSSIRPMCIGPLWLLSDALPPLGATVMFLLGPDFTYPFTGNTSAFGSLNEWTEVVMTQLLHRLSKRRVDVVRAAKRLSLVKCIAASQTDWTFGMAATLDDDDEAPREVLFRNFLGSHCQLHILGAEVLSLIASFKWSEELILWATHTPTRDSFQVQYVDTEIRTPLDLPRLLPSLGGLKVILYPWFEVVSSPSELTLLLKIMVQCLKKTPELMAEFLDQNGHVHLIAFISDHINWVDTSVLQALCKFAMSGSLKLDVQYMQAALDSKLEKFSYPVIVDVHAMQHIVLNPIFRNALNLNLQNTLVTLISYAVHPTNPNALFNSRLLRQIQFLPWVLEYIRHLCRSYDVKCDHDKEMLDMKQCGPRFVDPIANDILEQLSCILSSFLSVEAHIDDVQHISDCLLKALADESRWVCRCLLQYLLNDIESPSSLAARTLVDSVLHRLELDRGARLKAPLWYGLDKPLAFSPTGFEAILMEILLLTPSEKVMSVDGLLALRLLLSLSQVQPAFGAHLLVNSQLSIRLTQVLHQHKKYFGAAIPILAFVTLLPLHLVQYDATNLSSAFPEPSKYTPVAMDRVCIDTVWGILGTLWKSNQSDDEAEETSLKSFEWLKNRLEKDALVFQALCRSSLWFLTMSSRCIVLSDLVPNDTKTISSRAAQCLISFLKKSLFERDDWADNMLYCFTLWYELQDGAEIWLNLLLQLLEEVLLPSVSVVAMKNLCSVFVGLLRMPTTEINSKPNKKSSIVLPQLFICKVVEFITRTISHLSVATPSLGDESERYFYSILVFTVQCYLIQGICKTKEYRNDHVALLTFAIQHKELLLQQMNGSSILVYATTQGVGDIYTSGFRLNMRQLSLTNHHTQKELPIGTETDRIFILCFATGLLKLLVEYNESVAWVAVQLWKFLLTQRPMLMQELLIVEPKTKLLNSMSASKTSTIDMFHKGMDQLLVVNGIPSVEWQVFYTWLTANVSTLRDMLPPRTDPMFASISELVENVISIRKTSRAELTIHVPIVQAQISYTTPPTGEIDQQLNAACAQLIAVEKQVLHDCEKAMHEAYRNWQQTHGNQIHRSLWKTSRGIEKTKSSASVYQTLWMGEMALDSTEGPCRMRLRLKAWKNESTDVVNDAQSNSSVKGTIVDVFSILQQCLEFHDLVEVYRQCTSKYTTTIDRELLFGEITSHCKVPKSRERLQDIEISPIAIAHIIYQQFLQNDHFLSLGISSAVVQDVAKAIESGSSDQLPSTLFDGCDSDAMQNSLLRKPSVSLAEDEDDKDEDDKGEGLSDVSDEEDEEQTPSSRLSILSTPDTSMPSNQPQGIVDQTTFGCILRYLHRNDLSPIHSCNVVYINGMQKAMGVFLFCQIAVYFIEGYCVVPVAEDDERKKRTHLQTIVDLTEVLKTKTSSFRVQPRSDSIKASNITWRLKYDQIKQFYRIKYQLRPVGLEFVDVGGATFFCTYDSKAAREDVFKTLFTMPIRNSIYWAHVLRPGPLSSFKRLRQSFTKKWLRGEMSNFEYLIELNAMAGRSFNDLTQYPVFPWVLADYTSDTLDLTNPQSFRDLSKPMGALGSTRSLQFQERFQAMSCDGFDSPAFHYGTHYSCSAYVTYYLLRLEPYTSMAKELQGGVFDKADRLFRSIGASWLSASSENLQDVRELIPEFYYLPEFLVNANRYDLGTTQNGIVVDDVVLPPWARGDPREFIRLHRQALESKYVSENLHQWIDLIFGYKQRGDAAIEAQNVFMHLTYEGAIDIDAIVDPVIREATLAQIENFGQTPSKLFNSPHPQRKVPSLHLQSHSSLMSHAHDLSLNAQSSIEAFVKWHAPLAPPLVSIGKEYVNLKKASCVHLLQNEAIGDIKLSGDKFVGRGLHCTLVPPRFKKYIDWSTEGLLVLRSLPKGKALFTIAGAHFSSIRCAAFSDDGSTLVSGGDDGVVSVFQCIKVNGQRIFTHTGKLAAHDDAVLCVAIDKSFNLIVSGSKDLSAIVWDARTQLYVRELCGHSTPILHVGINASNGNIMTATASEIRLWSINGDLLASASLPTFGLSPITSAMSIRCDMWQNGVVIVTGHSNGTIACWGIQYPSDIYKERLDLKKNEPVDAPLAPSCRLFLMKLLLEHRAAVTAVDSDQRQLLSADADGVCIKWQDDA